MSAAAKRPNIIAGGKRGERSERRIAPGGVAATTPSRSGGTGPAACAAAWGMRLPGAALGVAALAFACPRLL